MRLACTLVIAMVLCIQSGCASPDKEDPNDSRFEYGVLETTSTPEIDGFYWTWSVADTFHFGKTWDELGHFLGISAKRGGNLYAPTYLTALGHQRWELVTLQSIEERDESPLITIVTEINRWTFKRRVASSPDTTQDRGTRAN